MLLPTPLAFRIDGRPIWAFAGGAPEGEGEGGGGGGSEGGDGGDPGDGGGTDTTVGTDGLTQAGRDAIARERTTLKTVRGELRGYKAVLSELGITTPEALRERLAAPQGGQQGQQQQVDPDAIRRQVEGEVRIESNRRVALAEVKAEAARTFADPADAVLYLQGEVDELLSDDGSPDTAAIQRSLAGLLTRKPHLAAQQQEEPPPSFDGGTRGTPGAPVSFGDYVRGQVAAKRGHV
jgi:hypothetical protein